VWLEDRSECQYYSILIPGPSHQPSTESFGFPDAGRRTSVQGLAANCFSVHTASLERRESFEDRPRTEKD
jgi:hypothetical protein